MTPDAIACPLCLGTGMDVHVIYVCGEPRATEPHRCVRCLGVGVSERRFTDR